MHKSISDSLHTPIKNKQGPFQSDTEVKKKKKKRYTARQSQQQARLSRFLFFLIAVLVQSRTPHYWCVVFQRKGFCWPTAVAPAGMPT